MVGLEYKLLIEKDPDIRILKKMHSLPEIKKYISISRNYFKYVTETENVFYYKIILNGEVIGGIHFEKNGETAYISVCIHPDYQNKGYGKRSVEFILNKFKETYKNVEVGIDEYNFASIRLFEGLGFEKADVSNGLITYILRKTGDS